MSTTASVSVGKSASGVEAASCIGIGTATDASRDGAGVAAGANPGASGALIAGESVG